MRIYTGYQISKWSGCLYDNSLVSLFNIFRFLLFTAFGLFIFAPAVYSEENIIEKMVTLNYNILLVNSGLMALPLILNSKNNKKFFDIVRTELYQPEIKLSYRQSIVQKSTNKFLKLFIKHVAIYYYASLMVNFFRRPVLMKQKDENDFYSILPVICKLPFEVKSWTSYILVSIFQFVIASNMVTAHLGMLITFVIHAKLLCKQFETSTIYIQETFQIENNEEIKKDLKNKHRQNFIEYRVNSFIEQHVQLLKYLKLFQEMYSVFLLLFAISSGAMVCTVAYIITEPKSTATMIMIGLVCIFLTEVIIIGTYCWFGQKVTDQCASVGEVIYNIPWYTQSVKLQKSIVIILAVCQRKRIIKGGGVQKFSMEGLSELLQTSFSYFNMLKAMR